MNYTKLSYAILFLLKFVLWLSSYIASQHVNPHRFVWFCHKLTAFDRQNTDCDLLALFPAHSFNLLSLTLLLEANFMASCESRLNADARKLISGQVITIHSGDWYRREDLKFSEENISLTNIIKNLISV